MAKFNIVDKRGRVTSPVVQPLQTKTSTVPTTVTHEGVPAFELDDRAELFLLATTRFFAEGAFYEGKDAAAARFLTLAGRAAVHDFGWFGPFVAWLRGQGNIRTGALAAAVEGVRARVDAGCTGGNRQVIRSVIQRADEPGEVIACWYARQAGSDRPRRPLPRPISHGVADSVLDLYTERSALKWDGDGAGWRFADVIEMVRPKPRTAEQSRLFKHLLDRRHGNAVDVDVEAIPATIGAAKTLTARVQAGDLDALYDPAEVKRAGLTWENVFSLGGPEADKARLWAAVIPTMGYMALLRNLRAMDEAGLPDDVAEVVARRIADPDEVARSRQFPFRFLAAYEQTSPTSVRWANALEKALNLSLGNVPQLDGGTLVLVDTSGSMSQAPYSARSTMAPIKAAAVFGVVTAIRSGADLVGFADSTFTHTVTRQSAALPTIERFMRRVGEVGHGTYIGAAIRNSVKSHHRRIIIVSDGQSMDLVEGKVPQTIPEGVTVYSFDLGGYAPALMPSRPDRIRLGGLTDATFRLIPQIEQFGAGVWPWEQPAG